MSYFKTGSYNTRTSKKGRRKAYNPRGRTIRLNPRRGKNKRK